MWHFFTVVGCVNPPKHSPSLETQRSSKHDTGGGVGCDGGRVTLT